MFKATIFGLATAALALPAMAQQVTVSDIAVEADFSAVDDSDVLQRWPDLEADLQSVIAQALQPRADEDGYDIRVTLNEVSLDGVTSLGETGEFNTMSGSAAVYTQSGEILGNTDISLRAELADIAVPPNAIVTLPSETVFYNAMLVGFAAQVDDELDQVQLRVPTENSDDSTN